VLPPVAGFMMAGGGRGGPQMPAESGTDRPGDVGCPAGAFADCGIPVNYDEALVGTYTLPDPLLLSNGQPVRDAKTWNEKRRPEIVRLFEENEYGRAPGRPAGMSFDVFDKGTPAFGWEGHPPASDGVLLGGQGRPEDGSALYLPADARKPSPLLLNISFSANSTVVNDPGVKPGQVWGREHQRVPAPTGMAFGRINVARFAGTRHRLCHRYYGDIDPDFSGWCSVGSAGDLPPARARRVGRHLGLGLGLKPRHGLPGNRPGRGCQARRHHGSLALGKVGDVGGRSRPALRHGDRQLFG